MRPDAVAAQNGPMPDDTDDELARLQVRAYGPAADIDAAGLARLAELQENRAAPSAPARDAASAADTLAALFGPPSGPADTAVPTRRGLRAGLRDDDLAPAPAAEVVLEPLPDAAPEASEKPPAPVPPRIGARIASSLPGGRMRWVWLASIAAAVVVTALVTGWMRPSDGAGRAGTLTLQTDTGAGERTRGSMSTQDGARYYGEYLGLHIYSLDSCLEASVGDARRPIWGACGGEGLVPIMEVYVTGSGVGSNMPLPEQVLERFPDGGVMRFTLRGDAVLVDEGSLPSRR